MDLHRVTTDHCLDGYCCRAGSSIWSLRIIVGELLVLAGTGSPVPPESGPNLADPDVSPDDLAGKHVETGGEVIATDPVVIDVDDSTTNTIPIENAPDMHVGQDGIMLVGYAIALSWRYDWITYPYNTWCWTQQSSQASTGSNWYSRRRRCGSDGGFDDTPLAGNS